MNIGDEVCGYTILEHLDTGGMGTVYKVSKDGQEYALKTCISTAPERTKRFKREIRLMEAIEHNNVINVLYSNDFNDCPFFIMPLCDSSLSSAVRTGLTDNQKFDYVKQFCEGMQAIHDAGEVHRDVKPNNALILAGRVMVSDLGLGKFVDRDSTVLTPTRAFMGSEGYIPPEIYIDRQGRDADNRSDIYSIGCLIYYVFSNGLSPTHMDSSKIQADIYSIVKKCTKISPNDRYQNISELIQDLKTCEQTRKRPLTIQETISRYRRGVNDRQFYDALYNHLLTLQNDLPELIHDLHLIGMDYFRLLLKYKKDNIDSLASLLLDTYKFNDDYVGYSIPFEEIEFLVGIARLLSKVATSLQLKQDLLSFSIAISLEYYRFPAMQIVGEMLKDLSESEIKQMGVFFTNEKDSINTINATVTISIPSAIKNLLK